MSDSSLNFVFEDYDIDANKAKLNSALKYLQNIKDPAKILDNEKCQEACSYIQLMVMSQFYRDSKEPTKIFLENNYQYIWTDLMAYYSQICDKLETSESIKVSILTDTQHILNYLVTYEIQFRLFFFINNGVKSLLNILNNKHFRVGFSSMVCFELMAMNVNWASKNADLYKSEWTDLGAAEILLDLARNYPKCSIYTYMAFVNVANDKQIETFEDTEFIMKWLIEILNEVKDTFNSGKELIRPNQQFIEDDDNGHATEVIDHAVYCLIPKSMNVSFSVTGLMLALYRLSINNKIRYNMYVEKNLKEPLRVIIIKGNDIEKKYALQILAQLSFDSRVSELIRNDAELKELIKNLALKTDTVVKQLPKICKQISWVFELQTDKVAYADISTFNKKMNKIMISYNSASRELCLKIKDELEKNGFKVWIDVDEIHGSSLDAMAKAVESSDWILICVTEKYRQSINCQAEAQYAFKMKKPIVPLIMQKGYENVDGWLGLVLGDKIFINFMKYPFEECCRRLLNEIAKSTSSLNPTDDHLKVNTMPVTAKPSNSALNWDDSQVNAWFKEKNIDQSIVKLLIPCNGELLYQLYQLQNDAPEFFYQSLAKNNNISLRSLLLFTLSLKKLF